MTTHGGYQKCANCGHIRDRHDRVALQPDGRKMHWGCLHNWRRAGEKNFRRPCQCDRFVERSPR